MVNTKTILTWCADNIPTWFYFPSPADGGTEVSHSTLLFWICSENRRATQNTCFIVWRSRITDSYLPHRPFQHMSCWKKIFFWVFVCCLNGVLFWAPPASAFREARVIYVQLSQQLQVLSIAMVKNCRESIKTELKSLKWLKMKCLWLGPNSICSACLAFSRPWVWITGHQHLAGPAVDSFWFSI